MLKHLLKDGLESRDPASRRAAIMKLDANAAESQQKLARLACNDADEEVCLAAISRLHDAVVLADLTTAAASSTVIADAARHRLEQLLGQADDEVAANGVDQAQELLLQSGKPGNASLVCCLGSSETLRDRALQQLTDESDLVHVVAQSRFHATRLEAARRLSTKAAMEQALKSIKTRDKLVARSLQARIQEFNNNEKAAESHRQETGQLLASVESLAASVWSPQYAARLTALKERWMRLEPSPDSDTQARFDKYHDQCALTVTEHQQRDQAAGYCETAIDELARLTSDLTSTALPELMSNLGASKQQLLSIQSGWRISEPVANPSDALKSRFRDATEVAQQFIQDAELAKPILSRDSNEQREVSELKTSVTSIERVLAGASASAHANAPLYVELGQQRDRLNTRLRVLKQEQDAKVKSVQKLLSSAAQAINEKRWSQGNSLINRAQKKLDKLTASPAGAALAERLLAQQKKLQELGDWVDFAARPKLTALCEQMEALPGKGLKPTELAAAIKALQEEWKSIGMGPCSQELWPRFKTAGDSAFEPCAAYFASRSTERAAKLENKREICAQLERYLDAIDWASADWKSVEKTLRVAKNEWRNNRITDRKPDAELEQHFTRLVARFNEQLDQQYDQNAEKKQELIARAKVLAESEISQHVVNQARRLQTSWKQTGIMRRKQDQALWEEFNQHCRHIHKTHRDAEKAKQESGLAHVKTARDIIKQLRALARGAEPDEKTFSSLQDQFNALAEFPERDRKGLLRDFNQVSDQFSRLRDSSSVRLAQSEMAELQRRSALCSRYEQLLGEPDIESALTLLDAEWDDQPVALPRDWDKKISQRRKVALNHLKNGTRYDYEVNEKARRLLCIRAEILHDRETPAEDKSLRMAHQLESLQQGLGQTPMSDKRAAARELQVEWLTALPAPSEQSERLDQRFEAGIG